MPTQAEQPAVGLWLRKRKVEAPQSGAPSTLREPFPVNGTTIANAATDPHGYMSGTGFQPESQGLLHFVPFELPRLDEQTLYTFSVYAKPHTGRWIAIGSNEGSIMGFFDIVNGLAFSQSGVSSTSTSSPINGWCRISMSFRGRSSITSMRVYTATSSTTVAHTSTNSIHMYLWGVQLTERQDLAPVLERHAIVVDASGNVTTVQEEGSEDTLRFDTPEALWAAYEVDTSQTSTGDNSYTQTLSGVSDPDLEWFVPGSKVFFVATGRKATILERRHLRVRWSWLGEKSYNLSQLDSIKKEFKPVASERTLWDRILDVNNLHLDS